MFDSALPPPAPRLPITHKLSSRVITKDYRYWQRKLYLFSFRPGAMGGMKRPCKAKKTPCSRAERQRTPQPKKRPHARHQNAVAGLARLAADDPAVRHTHGLTAPRFDSLSIAPQTALLSPHSPSSSYPGAPRSLAPPLSHAPVNTLRPRARSLSRPLPSPLTRFLALATPLVGNGQAQGRRGQGGIEYAIVDT
jgi:hypothetical protein